jgi:DNA-binding MarR family transcriptional regulator
VTERKRSIAGRRDRRPEARARRATPAPAVAPARDDSPEASWTFLTNHAHVLLCLAREPGARIRDVAADVGITERAVQRIVVDLEQAGYLRRRRAGRRNRYELRVDLPLRHPLEQHRLVSSLLALVRER